MDFSFWTIGNLLQEIKVPQIDPYDLKNLDKIIH